MPKNVLIIGATSGIGEATACAFAREGANLILTGRRVERLEALKEELQTTYPGQKVWTFTLDVTDMDIVKDVCQAILKSVGQVHVLVNNAGLTLGLTAYQDYEEWDLLTMLDTNVKGLMMVTRQILPSMVAANEGHIINMGSTAGIYAYAGAAVYSATKAAVKTFSDGLRIDTIATDIKVTTIQPGIVETGTFLKFAFTVTRTRQPRSIKVWKPSKPKILRRRSYMSPSNHDVFRFQT